VSKTGRQNAAKRNKGDTEMLNTHTLLFQYY